MHTTTGMPATVYWYAAWLKNQKIKNDKNLKEFKHEPRIC
jgi:hypothetical protein